MPKRYFILSVFIGCSIIAFLSSAIYRELIAPKMIFPVPVKYQNSEPVINPSPVIPPYTPPMVEQISSSTGYKVYTLKDYGVEFQYSEYATPLSSPEHPTGKENVNLNICYEGGPDCGSLNIYIQPNMTYTNINDIPQNWTFDKNLYYSKKDIVKREVVKIGDKDVLQTLTIKVFKARDRYEGKDMMFKDVTVWRQFILAGNLVTLPDSPKGINDAVFPLGTTLPDIDIKNIDLIYKDNVIESFRKTGPSVNYTSLIKNRLYTEEEGKYENLNAEGKQLLRELVEGKACMANPDGPYCDQTRYSVQSASIIALYNDILVYQQGNFKGGYNIELYNLKTGNYIKPEKSFNNSFHTFFNGIRNDKIIIITDPFNMNKLLYYKIGMETFKNLEGIPPLAKNEYLFGSDWGSVEGYIKNNILTVFVFIPPAPENPADNRKNREIKIDLNSVLKTTVD